MQLRKFLYLDTKAVVDFSSQVAGGEVTDEQRRETIEGTKGGRGNIGVSGVGVGFDKTTAHSAEVNRVVRPNEAAMFEQVWQSLGGDDQVPYHEVCDDETWDGFRRREPMELQLNLQLSMFDAMTSLMGSFVDEDGRPRIAGLDMAGFDAAEFNAVRATLSRNALSVSGQFVEPSDPQFLLRLVRPDLRCEPGELNGVEATVFATIKRKVTPGGKPLKVETFGGLATAMNPAVLQAAIEEMTSGLPNDVDLQAGPAVLDPPAAELNVIAIYL